LVGSADGDLRISAANGGIALDLARATVVAKSANGDIRLGGAVRGSVVLRNAARRPRGRHPRGHRRLARRQHKLGNVHNTLDAADAPEPSAETVDVRARTYFGDVVIRRP
jgi:hypothetical protein